MEGKPLTKAPLIEAIFEIKWQLKAVHPGLQSDPHYGLLLGRVYDRLVDRYPLHEQLPTASIPTEMVGGMVQHRFRSGKDKWPLVQLGPGVFTVNDTDKYTWVDFEERVINGVNILFNVYPDKQGLKVNNLRLRYINAIEFRFDEEDIFEFLREQMKINISLHPPLFEDTGVQRAPQNFDCKFAFKCVKPSDAIIQLRLARGSKQNSDALIWETVVETEGDNVPDLPSGLKPWLDSAHAVVEDWFFALIEGDLQKRFE